MHNLFAFIPNTLTFTSIITNFAMGYDICQCLILLSNLYSHSTQNIVIINPKLKELWGLYQPYMLKSPRAISFIWNKKKPVPPKKDFQDNNSKNKTSVFNYNSLSQQTFGILNELAE